MMILQQLQDDIIGLMRNYIMDGISHLVFNEVDSSSLNEFLMFRYKENNSVYLNY